VGALGQDVVGALGVVDVQQDLFGLAVDAVHKRVAGVGDGMAFQNSTGKAADDLAMHAGGAQANHQQGGGFADDLVVKIKCGGILGMVAQKIFKVEEGHQPVPAASEDELAIFYDTKGCVFHKPELYFIVEIRKHYIDWKLQEKMSARLLDNPAQFL